MNTILFDRLSKHPLALGAMAELLMLIEAWLGYIIIQHGPALYGFAAVMGILMVLNILAAVIQFINPVNPFGLYLIFAIMILAGLTGIFLIGYRIVFPVIYNL